MEKVKIKRLKIFAASLVLVSLGLAVLFLNNRYEIKIDQKTPDTTINLVQADNNILAGTSNIADVVDRVSSAIVNIETKAPSNTTFEVIYNDPFFKDFFDDNMMRPREDMQSSIGTGFVIDPQGLVLTNQHVVDGASEITITFSGNKKYSGKIIGQDQELDLAIIKIDAAQQFPALTLGNSDKIRVGEWVVAIGNPYGLDHTVTAGVISAKGRPMKIENRTYRNLIQTDAAINPGNSGGPLLNTQGEVIGINTAVNVSAQGIGFAISINTAKDVLEELINQGKIDRGYIGVYINNMDENLARYLGVPNQGVLVVQVVPDSPADKAGIKKYDVILTMDNTALKTADDFQAIFKNKKPGERVNLNIVRGTEQLSFSVTMEEKPAS
ncbi:MAG: trypsin-like peptidase domain-containing protein [Syntrophomonas sp.]